MMGPADGRTSNPIVMYPLYLVTTGESARGHPPDELPFDT